MSVLSHVSCALVLAFLFRTHAKQEVLQELSVETHLGINLWTDGGYMKIDSSSPKRLSACVGEVGKGWDWKKYGVIWLGLGSCQVLESSSVLK